jgi:hypothetical protein
METSFPLAVSAGEISRAAHLVGSRPVQWGERQSRNTLWPGGVTILMRRKQ